MTSTTKELDKEGSVISLSGTITPAGAACTTASSGYLNLNQNGGTSSTSFHPTTYREVISVDLVRDTVVKIFKETSNTTLAIWPPIAPSSWYVKETYAPVDNKLELVSSVRGRKVPEYIQWEDEEA